jgi:hypothetical protein
VGEFDARQRLDLIVTIYLCCSLHDPGNNEIQITTVSVVGNGYVSVSQLFSTSDQLAHQEFTVAKKGVGMQVNQALAPFF